MCKGPEGRQELRVFEELRKDSGGLGSVNERE